jgi:DNA-binding SARP family transcriptional activator
MEGEIVRREALLDRLRRVEPRILVIQAPAGFGKSTLIRQYLAERGGGVVCDCSAVRDDLDLARRVIPALAAETPAREPDLTARELMLGDGGTSVADRIALALEAWKEPAEGCIIFENADHLTGAPSARELFLRMLAARPSGRTVAICSRDTLRLNLTRYAVLHEIVTLRAGDLAFGPDDIRVIFAPHVQDEAAFERIFAVSAGWPIIVFLLQRFASEGRIEAMLDALGDSALHELHDYLADEVLGELDPRVLRALFVCAATPSPTIDDLRAVFAHETIVDQLGDLARETVFLTLSGGRYRVHPLLASLLLEGSDEKRNMLLHDLALEHERRGAYQRAAELHVARGDQHAAARALGTYEVMRDHAPSMQYARILASLTPDSIARYPRLWGVTALMRMYCVQSATLLDEAEIVWRTISPDTTALERLYVFAFRVLLMAHTGLLDEALRAVDEFAASVVLSDPPKTVLDGYLLYLRGLLRARRGAFDLAERDLGAALPFVDRMDVVASGMYLSLGADIARVRGEWSLERQFLSRARERTGHSGLPNFIALNTAEMLLAAWFAGDRPAFNEAAAELDASVQRTGVGGFSYLAAVARGRSAHPTPVDLPKFVVFGHLIVLSRSRDEAERAELARTALELAGRVRIPFVEALAAIALALSDPAAFDDATAIARRAAARCDAPAFLHAVTAFANKYDNVGMLANFVAQITRDRSEAAPFALEVLTGRVRIGGNVVRLPGREFELLSALAQRRDATARGRLAEMLWPDLDEFAARNALSVCLHRLRAHLGQPDVIERDADGYRLHVDAFVDIWDIERASLALRARDRLRESERAALRRAWERLGEMRSGPASRWEWFEPTARRMDEVRAQIAHRLATDALELGDPDVALAYATEIIAHDPCDEPAHEVMIRAHLAGGDRAAALRKFRQYREVLRTELQVEPSAALAALVMDS